MAAGFKQVTAPAAKIAGTDTNYVSYVDLSRAGITTSAEAQSVRVYSDSGKTTELPRHIIDTARMAVKIPVTASTDFTLYVDWDGVRSDYGTGDTYGQYAVYTAWRAFYPMTETSGNIADATGDFDMTATGAPGNGTTSPWGRERTYSGSTSVYHQTSSSIYPSEDVDASLMIMIKPNSTGRGDPFGQSGFLKFITGSTSSRFRGYANYTSASADTPDTSNYSTGTWYLVATTINASTDVGKLYRNGSLVVTSSAGTGSKATNSEVMAIGTERASGTSYNAFNGSIGFAGAYDGEMSASLNTTMYNNYMSESTFWPTWTTVSGSSASSSPSSSPSSSASSSPSSSVSSSSSSSPSSSVSSSPSTSVSSSPSSSVSDSVSSSPSSSPSAPPSSPSSSSSSSPSTSVSSSVSDSASSSPSTSISDSPSSSISDSVSSSPSSSSSSSPSTSVSSSVSSSPSDSVSSSPSSSESSSPSTSPSAAPADENTYYRLRRYNASLMTWEYIS